MQDNYKGEYYKMSLKLTVLAAAAAMAAAIVAPTFACPGSDSCGSYTVNSQYATNKHSVLSSGGNTTWLAVGMEETNTLDSNYTYGDGKTGDGANFGYMKDNWYSYRTAVPQFSGQSSSQYNNGAVANGNYGNANSFANDIVSHYGWTGYWELHRDGQSGLNGWTSDINNYYQAIQWIASQINSNYSKYTTDQTRFWVSVPAI
jgi:hypothetical protein